MREFILDTIGAFCRTTLVYLTHRDGRTFREIYREVTDPARDVDDYMDRISFGCANRIYGTLVLVVLIAVLVTCVH